MTEITDEQRKAYESLSDPKRIFTASEIAVLAPLFPFELTNPQPALPNEPGHYEDEQGRHWLHQVYGPKSEPYHVDQWLDWNGQNGAPPTGKLTRLVPERPQITRERIESVIRAWAGSPSGAAAAVFDLVSGNDQ